MCRLRAARVAAFAAPALFAACLDSSGPDGRAQLLVTPILDSLFVGDTLAPSLRVTYVDAAGDTRPPGAVSWSSNRTAVAQVDATTGRVTGAGPGVAIVTATARGVNGRALVVVSRPLEVSLLLDTLYLMPDDTFTVPVEVLRRAAAPPAPWFEAPAQAVFTIDSATGLVTATATGGPFRFVVHADTVADTGAVEVRELTDTTGGAAFVTVLGTVIRRIGSPVRAVNYRGAGSAEAFRLHVTVRSAGVTIENVVVTLPNSVAAPGVHAIDSIAPDEAFTPTRDPICDPPRPWALWSTHTVDPPLFAFSRRGGTVAVTRVDTVAGGLAVSGRFAFSAQREDYYADALGALPVRGSFVAPLVRDTTSCR